MNRRHFFGMTAAALIGAGLPLSLLPERSIFLPPREGWYPSDFVMREVIQYMINADAHAVRHDALFQGPQGPVQSFTLVYLPESAVRTRGRVPVLNHSCVTVPDVEMFDDRILRELRKNARNKFAQDAFHAGLDAPRVLLPLPEGAIHAEYV